MLSSLARGVRAQLCIYPNHLHYSSPIYLPISLYYDRFTCVNVLLACKFNKAISFFCVGAEGSSHDSKVFSWSRMWEYIPKGGMILFDAALTCGRCCITPFKGVRYRLKGTVCIERWALTQVTPGSMYSHPYYTVTVNAHQNLAQIQNAHRMRRSYLT